MEILEMIDRRNELVDKARALEARVKDDKRSMTAEESADFDKMMSEVERLQREIDERVAAQPKAKDMAADLDWGEPRRRPRGGSGPLFRTADGREIRALTPEESVEKCGAFPPLRDGIRVDELSLGRWVRGVATADWKGAEAEHRAMGETLDIYGGYLLPSPVSARIVDLMRNKAAVMQAGAATLPMDSRDLAVATVTGAPTAYWKAEGAAGTESDMTLGRINMSARFLMGITRASIELIEDAANVGDLIQRNISESLALELDRAALLGAGSAVEPLGIFDWPGITEIDQGTDGGSLVGAGYYDVFSEAVQDIAEANQEARVAVLSPREAFTIDRWKDGQGLPLVGPQSWQSLRKITTNQIPVDMVKGASSNASCAFVGNFENLVVAMRTQLRLEISREAEDAFSRGQVLIRGYLRGDTAVLRSDGICVIKGITPG